MRLVEFQLLIQKSGPRAEKQNLNIKKKLHTHTHTHTHTQSPAKLSPASVLSQHGQMIQESNIKPRIPVIVRHTNAAGTIPVKLTMPSLHEL